MTVFFDISAALDGNLDSMSGKPPIALENGKYTPVMGTLFVRPTLIPGDTIQASLGSTGTDQSVGIYQIDIFSEAGEGKNEAIIMADLIADQFKRGTVMTYNSRTVRVMNVSRGSSVNNVDGWFQIPIVITYISFTQPRT